MGLEPSPGIVPIINLKTREIILYDFIKHFYQRPAFRERNLRAIFVASEFMNKT